MRTSCSYHPAKPAHFECSKCDADYCAECVIKRAVPTYGRTETYYYCPKCQEIVERLDISDIIDPFWIRLPKFFIYPFHPRPLVLMLLVSVGVVLFARPGLVNLLINIALWGVLLKYSHAALKNTANSRYYPPRINSETIADDFGIVFKQVAIFVIVGIALAKVAQIFGPFIALVAMVVAILSIPAMIIVLVATGSLLHAVNPVVFITMAWRIGWGYLLMYLFLTILGGAPVLLGRHIIAHLPASTHLFLLALAKCYYTIISYHLMGYVILQYHDDIGYEVELDDEDSILTENKVGQPAGSEILNRVDILIKEGKIDDAVFLIRSETGGKIAELELAERYYNLLKIKQNIPDLLRHAVTYLDLLAEAKDKEKLCEVYSECAARDPGFVPSSSTLFKVASCLNQAGNPKAAVNSYNRFVKANPKDPLLPKAYFLAANIIHEKLKNPKKAVGILKTLLKTYPNHEIIPHVQKYLRQIGLAK
ncbi:MAG: tetratricopeptide repeat protein [Deltaproteobacteria bacterium]|nr:tetratricopeptide repeat protein [Deltaproteobacteria bacterium]